MAITIIDYGLGNVASIANMLKYLKIPVCITADPRLIAGAEKLILPGVGAFDKGLDQLSKARDVIEAIQEAVILKKRPILGICLGMQLLMDSSEEGSSGGLGFIEGEVRKFPVTSSHGKIHMGWNSIDYKLRQNSLFDNFEDEMRFYFVHGYFVQPVDPETVIATSTYGLDFCAVINQENIYGVQFHPEKSHRFGKNLLENFGAL